jgi:predicted HNH restriction endonuclease
MKMKMKTKPEILTHPNIPKPLHGISPRTIMGEDWWNKTRQEVYARYDYHCIACGVAKAEAKEHQWLEAHEFWNIDYYKGVCEIKSIEPLCHYCHNFIHSGRLKMIMGKDKTREQVKAILEHGMKILSDNKLACFPSTFYFAQDMGCNTYQVYPYEITGLDIPWNEWKLVWNGKEYHSKFQSFEEWRSFYSHQNNRNAGA